MRGDEHGALRRGQVLRHRNRRDVLPDDVRQPVERGVRRVHQRLGTLQWPGTAQLVRAFAVEAEETIREMQPHAHAPSRGRRRHDIDVGHVVQPARPPQRIGEHVGLELQLACVPDVRQRQAATAGVVGRVDPIG